MSRLTAEAVKAAILKWPGRYQTEAGQEFWGSPVSEIPSQLRDSGWRNVSRMDDQGDLELLGLRVVIARYVGGARPKRFCRVVVAAPYCSITEWAKNTAGVLQWMAEQNQAQ